MERIVPHLWFDTEAKEAADFYVSLFPDSKVEGVTTLHDTPAGDADIVSFKLAGKSFMATNAGPAFTFNPSISFILNFDPSKDKNARENMSRIWEKLANDGDILMPLQKYDFSEFYGWVQDKYGLSWQLILSDPEGEERPFIMSSLLFTGDVYGKAEDTMNYYLSIFSEQDDARTKKGALFRYEEVQGSDDAEAVMFADFMVLGQWFSAMDSARQHGFAFNEAVSFMVYCDTQEEIDFYWEKLSAVPESEQCGWLKDKFGVSWQIVPGEMDEMLSNGTEDQIARVTQAFLPMKKIDIAELERAYEGEST